MNLTWRNRFLKEDKMECYFCGKEGSPVYRGAID